MKLTQGVMLAAGVIWTVVSVFLMTYGTLLNWPDYVHTNYGFPWTFAVHTANTIAGPVDKWSVDLNAFAGDFAFWVIGILVILVVTVLLQGRPKTRASAGV